MDLYLMRSGAGLPSDVDQARPLSPVARGHIQTAARVMVRLGVGIEALVCARSLRAAQTAEIMAQAMDFPGPSIQAEGAFATNGQVEAAIAALAGLGEVRAVLCIGHAPLLEHLASTLLCGSPVARVRFEPAGLAHLEVPELPSRAAVLHWLMGPAQLRLLATA